MDRANLLFITTDHQRANRIFMRQDGLEITHYRHAPLHAEYAAWHRSRGNWIPN